MGKWRFYEFIKTAGALGGGSVILAILCFGITLVEHVKDHNVSASIFGLLTILFFCFGGYQAWNVERDERIKIEKKYLDEKPQIGLEIHSYEGPTAWTSAYAKNVCVFTLHQISGRIAQSIQFDPIPSKGGKFVLNFDPVSFLDPAPTPTSLRYEINEPPHPRPSGADLEKMGDMEGKLLYLFLVDSPPELTLLEYSLTATFKDRSDERIQTFKIVFDTRTYRFLPSTN
jgi:hypothetical protein